MIEAVFPYEYASGLHQTWSQLRKSLTGGRALTARPANAKRRTARLSDVRPLCEPGITGLGSLTYTAALRGRAAAPFLTSLPIMEPGMRGQKRLDR